MACWKGLCRLCRRGGAAVGAGGGEVGQEDSAAKTTPLRVRSLSSLSPGAAAGTADVVLSSAHSHSPLHEAALPECDIEDKFVRRRCSEIVMTRTSSLFSESDISARSSQRFRGGKIQDHYALQWDELGEGSFSTVRVASCNRTGIDCAVKMVVKRDIENHLNFQNEIDLARAMNHPNIIRVFETFEDHRNFYLVMELCTGGELFERIVDVGEISERQASVLMQQICGTIVYMHAEGVCHRDLKPENFVFSGRGALESTPLKLIDFGLSRRFKPGQVMTTAVGTVLYVAPEVFTQAYGPSCDLWSFGVITYCLLCGNPPFDGATAKQVAKAVRKSIYKMEGEVWESISPDAKDLISKLLLKRPEDRLTPSQVLEHPWIWEKAPKSSGEPLGLQHLEALHSFGIQNRRARSLQKRFVRSTSA